MSDSAKQSGTVADGIIYNRDRRMDFKCTDAWTLYESLPYLKLQITDTKKDIVNKPQIRSVTDVQGPSKSITILPGLTRLCKVRTHMFKHTT